jgi:hypothetical protein
MQKINPKHMNIDKILEANMLHENATPQWQRAMMTRDAWSSLWIPFYKWQQAPPSTPLTLGTRVFLRLWLEMLL